MWLTYILIKYSSGPFAFPPLVLTRSGSRVSSQPRSVVHAAGHPDALMYFKSIIVWLHGKIYPATGYLCKKGPRRKQGPFIFKRKLKHSFYLPHYPYTTGRLGSTKAHFTEAVCETEHKISLEGSNAVVFNVVLITATAYVYVFIEQIEGG